MKIELYRILQIVFVVCVLSSGCSDSDSPSGSTKAGPDSGNIDLSADSEEDEKPQAGPPFRVNRESKDVFRPWLMYVKGEESEFPIGEIGFVPVPGSDPPRYEAGFRPTKEGEGLQVANALIKPESVEVTFAIGSQFQLFQGELHDGIVFGNLVNGEGVCLPVRLLHPEADQRIQPEPFLVEGIYEFSDVMKNGAKWDDLVKFIEDHPESPLLPNAFYALFLQVRPREIPVAKTEELFALIDRKMILWGERLKNFVRLNSVLQLANDYRHPELLETIYKSLEGKFDEPVWKEPVEMYMVSLKKDIELARMVESLRQADEKNRSEILAQLQKEADANRFNAKLLVSTAEALSDLEDRQDAVDWYLKLVVVPGLQDRYMRVFERFWEEVPKPSERLKELWKDVHASEEGLQQALAEEYEQLLSTYELPESEFPQSNGKHVLIELFTGTACHPCVAADLAFTVLRDRLPQDRVVMLQYHVHIPSFDPLTCEETTGRFNYYRPRGTPTTIVDGRTIDALAGDAGSVSRVLQPLVNEIVEESSRAPLMQIDLKVTPRDDGTAAFEAAVAAEEISDRWRLHIVLAEGEVRYQAPNGVPVHEMVVRKIYTSSQGLEPSGGSLALSGSIDPEQIRKELNQQFAALQERQFEAAKEALAAGQDPELLAKQTAVLKERLDNELKGIPLDLDDLYLVAFVQDSRSQRIRQAVSVPVASPSGAASVSP